MDWHAPLDPECPEVEHAFMIPVEEDGKTYWIEDPMGASVMDELWEDFEKKHRAKCERCKEYGLANIEVGL